MTARTVSVTLVSLILLCRLVKVSHERLEEISHSRQKRVIWITHDGRLAFPPGTAVNAEMSLEFPFLRDPPDALTSSFSSKIKFSVNLDKLGLTDEENPYGKWISILEDHVGRASGALVGNYLRKFMNMKRGKRSLDENLSKEIEEYFNIKFHGGERAVLYIYLENILMNFGISGKECLLRTICETHAHPLQNHGFLGEVFHLFFTPSTSEYAHLINEYVEAEDLGKMNGECYRYNKACPKSIFRTSKSSFTKDFYQNRNDTIKSANEEIDNIIM